MSNPKVLEEKLLSILACPCCKKEVELKLLSELQTRLIKEDNNVAEDNQHTEDDEQFLVCFNCKLAYPVIDDIPIMLDTEALPLEN